MTRFPEPYIPNQKPIQFLLRPFAVLGFGVWFWACYLIF
jgi:hypothetical protein